ncbi:hypothetical protein GCM10009007_10100 [Formosimonas limnophila]|uniref:HTH marR-type domain-containing protein n=1 Tax=Formosimonas limnophila TaxID=1384487 RepID=A0A8J3CKK8_9BURK|nr:MarR family winged helix-turn-helix transcriptional regulator [Formosimonas limnophila]GHA71191.1 hypothetical protein GCM10009007_10100 [Formosimonas limnophila]
MSNSPSNISNLQSHLGFWLRFVSNHVSGSFREKVEALGVSVSEWVVLRELLDQGEASPSALVEKIGMTKGGLSKLLVRLEGKQLLQRYVRDDDRRHHLVVLTEAGRRLVIRLAAVADANDEAFFGHLSLIEQQHLIEAMKSLVRHHNWQHWPVG